MVGDFDVLIVGTGLGAAVIARRLSGAGEAVGMVPGVGCARFKHLEAFQIDSALIERAFGSTTFAPLQVINGVQVAQRDQLERWAIERISGEVDVLLDFEESRVVPNHRDGLDLIDVSGTRTLSARLILLTEGANPKIGIAAGLRPDFAPEDMIHFGRAFVSGAKVNRFMNGAWRTSWGMPAWYSATPWNDGAFVSASARIENIMRASRDGRDTLRDMLDSPFAEELDVYDFQGEVGMELVPLCSNLDPAPLGFHNLAITPDANGLIDPRSPDRFDTVLRTALAFADQVAASWPSLPDWDQIGDSMWEICGSVRTPYHDDSETGFVEDGPGKKHGLLSRFRRR